MSSDNVEVRSSTIQGQGVYARRPFAPGETVLCWDTSQTIANASLSLLPENERRYTHPFDDDQTLIVQPPERFVNHSCDNNTVVRNFCDVAIKPIAIGDEITSDYGSDGASISFRCSCGSVNCRGTIGG